MKDMNQIRKEAEEYKNYSKRKLSFVISLYSLLRFFNNETLNFITSFVLFSTPILLLTFSTFSILMCIVLHYLIVWKLVVKKIGVKLVSDTDVEEINSIIDILKSYKEKGE